MPPPPPLRISHDKPQFSASFHMQLGHCFDSNVVIGTGVDTVWLIGTKVCSTQGILGEQALHEY